MKQTVLIILMIISVALGSVDSQWRGPSRDGIYPNETLLKEWPDAGPKLIWSADGLGEGYSSVAVTSDRLYVTGMIKGTGYLFAFDMNGKLVWKVLYGPEWDKGHPGARTTPTIVGDKIYLMSAFGNVVCLNTAGKLQWQVDLMKSFGARNLDWGMTESLVIDGDSVICTPGGRGVMLAALDRHTGKTIWKTAGNGEESAYCSPVIVQHGNLRLMLTMTAKSLVGLNADTGEYLWKQRHVTRYDINPNTPLYHDGYIFAVSGYGTGGQMFKLSPDGKRINRVWANDTIDSQFGAVSLVDGYIYGSGHSNRGWHCMDWKTGKIQFSERVLGNKGNIIYSDGMMYCYGESGEFALVRPNPSKLDIVSSFKVTRGSGPHWAHPVIKNGRLYVRHGDVLTVYDITR